MDDDSGHTSLLGPLRVRLVREPMFYHMICGVKGEL